MAGSPPTSVDASRFYALTGFIGRKAELSAASDVFASSRLVTLTGTGGIGKTRLAREMASSVADHSTDGSWFIDLSPVAREADVAEAVVAGMGLSAAPTGGAEHQLRTQLMNKSTMLVLDNCEHVLAGCRTLVSSLLAVAPELRILATSREPLGLVGERLVVVRPLEFPSNTAGLTAAEARQYDAVALLERRAAAVNDQFALTDENADIAAELCARLDGLPLAIELAVARLRTLTIEQLLDRLHDRFAILSKGDPTASPHHQTLRSLVSWSYDLCSDDERILWHRLSAFAGGADLEAVENVCAAEPLNRTRALDALDGLVSKSILMADANTDPVRYRFLETLREFGREAFNGSEDLASTQGRHAAHYRDFATRAARGFFSDRQQDWMSRVASERPNLGVAFDYLRQQEAEGCEDALRLASSLRFYWTTRQLREGRRWLEEALNECPDACRARCDALWAVAWVASLQGEAAKAKSYLAEARSIADEIGADDVLPQIETWRGTAHLFSGDLEEARCSFENAAVGHRKSRNHEGLLMSLFQLGITRLLLDDHEAGLEACSEALSESERCGESWARSYTYWVLAHAAWVTGHHEQAKAHVLESLRIKRGFNDGVGTALVLSVLASVAADEPDPEFAAQVLGIASSQWDHLGTGIDAFGPQMARTYAPAAERAQSVLGADRYRKLFEEGRSLDADAWYHFLTDGTSSEAEANDGHWASLTGREREVATLLAQGMSNRDIAAQLVLSPRTVEGHVQHLLAKLGLRSRAEGAVWAASKVRGQQL